MMNGNKDKIMKNKLILVLILTLSINFMGCQQPDELLPPVSRNGINSVTASFPDGTGNFVVTVDAESTDIVIPIPYFYPEDSENVVNEEQIKKMKVKANLDDNVIIEPALTFMDLTKPNLITVIDQRKERRQYTIRGEIQKSKSAFIEEFRLPSFGLAGIINNNDNIISLVSIDDLSTPALAELTLSYHATISPDPRIQALNFEQEQELTVTAHDGVTTRTYTVKKSIPEKIPFGIRPESAKLLFAKKLNADLGIVDGFTTGIAVTDKYVVINSRGNNSVYIDSKTGEKIGEIDLGALKGANKNFYNTSDSDGNILISNLTSAGSTIFTISKLSNVDAVPVTVINWDTGGKALGRKFSINGSVDSNAIITVPINFAGGTWGSEFARWQITGGNLVSTTPEIVNVIGLANGWNTNVDIVHSSATDVNSDYYVSAYKDNQLSWVNGNTNVISTQILFNRADFVPNTVDFIEFNKAKFLAANFINGMTSGTGDIVWILDATTNTKFNQGNLNASTSPAIVWESPRKVYGALGIDAPKNDTYGADVLLKPSADGYFLYLYFIFNNGSVVGYQFDCVKI